MLEFNEDPDYEYLLNLFKDELDKCNMDEPDFDWNKELKLEKHENYMFAKNLNKSMINQKSNTSHLIKANETIYQCNTKSSGINLKQEK